jgi:N-carbamoylputrescine amidase
MRLAVAQLTTEPFAAEANRARTVDAARSAFEDGADLVVLPELAVSGYTADAEALEAAAEPADGATFEAWRAVAAQAGGIVVGGFCERSPAGLYNSVLGVDADGPVLHYRKLHLFAEEKHRFLPGDLGLPVARTGVGVLGVCVCYDLRFVEVVRLLALRGVELVCVPTAWLVGYDRERWDERGLCPQAHGALLQANLSQVFVACASQAGLRHGLEFLGSSVVADPWGKLALGPLSGTDEAVAAVDVDLADVERARVRAPLITPLLDRRTDVYGVRSGDEIL